MVHLQSKQFAVLYRFGQFLVQSLWQQERHDSAKQSARSKDHQRQWLPNFSLMNKKTIS